MVKKIFHLADIHIPNIWDSRRPYDVMLSSALQELYTEVQKYDADEVRIVVSGDICQSKNKISPEANSLLAKFFNILNLMAKTIVICGNHDMLASNKSRMDALTPQFTLDTTYPNITYLDKELGYKSGCLKDDDIIWCLYSMFDDFKAPEDLESLKSTYPDCKLVGLYHGDIVGATTDIGRVCSDGLPYDSFNGCSCAMLGHIHKYQEIKKNGIPFVYAGSLLQHDFGENTTGHGFVVWDMEAEPTPTHKLVEVKNDYRLFRLTVSSYDDVNNDVEKLLNL